MKKYVILEKLLGGYMVITLKEYKENELFQCHPILAQGTKKQLKKMGIII